MASPSTRLLRYVAVAAVLVLLFLLTRLGGLLATLDETITRTSAETSAANATLGFEKILVIYMPTRFDRRDMHTLLGATYGLNFTYQPGVEPSSVNDNPSFVRPGDRDWSKQSAPEAAAYRAHAEAWRRVIDEGWSSALILEPDNDFDTEIKFQMGLLSQQMSKLVDIGQGTGHKTTAHEPYTVDWDIFFLGHCGEFPPEGNEFVEYDDPTVPAFATKRSFFLHELINEPMQQWKERLGWDTGKSFNKRVVQRARGPLCTHGYGVTRRGAMRLLHSTLFQGHKASIDLRVDQLLLANELIGYSVMSPLFYQYRFFDSTSNSDRKVTPIVTAADEPENGPPSRHGEELIIKLGYGPRNSALRAMSEKLWPKPDGKA